MDTGSDVSFAIEHAPWEGVREAYSLRHQPIIALSIRFRLLLKGITQTDLGLRSVRLLFPLAHRQDHSTDWMGRTSSWPSWQCTRCDVAFTWRATSAATMQCSAKGIVHVYVFTPDSCPVSHPTARHDRMRQGARVCPGERQLWNTYTAEDRIGPGADQGRLVPHG